MTAKAQPKESDLYLDLDLESCGETPEEMAARLSAAMVEAIRQLPRPQTE